MRIIILLLAVFLWLCPVSFAQDAAEKPITFKTMGSLMFGGKVDKAADGETFHGDHGYAQYYIPQDAREYPLIFWHGVGQNGKSFETTPDGREGFQAIFPRRDWPVYIIDQPRRGRAGHTKSIASNEIMPTTERESEAWNAFRDGVWVPPGNPTLFKNTQFSATPAAIDQFFRQQTPNTGAEPRDNEYRKFMAETMEALVERIGPAILVTHSNSVQYDWFSGMNNPDEIRAIVAYEPGQFVFPNNEPVGEIPSKNDLASKMLVGIPVPPEEFNKLTKMPILVIYGDNIANEPSEIFNVEVWRLSRERSKAFTEAINRHGGDATLVELPKIGITGNTHAAFADLNNVEIANHLENWLKSKGLDKKEAPHQGPAPLILDYSPIDIAE